MQFRGVPEHFWTATAARLLASCKTHSIANRGDMPPIEDSDADYSSSEEEDLSDEEARSTLPAQCMRAHRTFSSRFWARLASEGLK